VLKHADNTTTPVQAEIKWLGCISHDNFHLAVDSGWKHFEDTSWQRPFAKTKSLFLVVQPTSSTFSESWPDAIEGAKELMQITCKFELNKINQLVVNNAFKLWHLSFEVVSHYITLFFYDT